MKKIHLFLFSALLSSYLYAEQTSFDSIKNNILTRFQKDVTDTRIYQTEKLKVIEVELPGYGKENISLNIENQNLIILAKVNQDNSYQKLNKVYHNSIFVGDVLSSDISSEYKDGILYITIPLEKIKPIKSEKIEIK